MRRACAISSAAHRRAMRAARPGLFEYQIEAELLHEFLHEGAQAVAYGSIVASRAERLRAALSREQPAAADGDLLLIDAGCEFQGYASDITRTFPVNGEFTGPQRAVYELGARRAACLHRRGEAGRVVARLPSRRRARARAGVHRSGAPRGTARRGARKRQLQALLHASRRALARHGRARRRALPGAGESLRLVARHGADRGAGRLHPTGGRRARRATGTSACASRTTCW